MDKDFRSTLPAEFVQNTLSLCGDGGETWLANLPHVIADLELRWNITVEPPFPNIGYNFVAPATTTDGRKFVLKLALPLDSTEFYSEAQYLRTVDGNGAVNLINFDRSTRAMLIERAMPGKTLTSLFESRELESLEPAIAVLQNVLRSPPTDRSDTISLDDWFDGLNRYREKGFPERYARKALEIYDSLAGQPGRTFYLHGDFHPDNIVSSGRSPYLLIDPKGINGHLGYEIGIFLNNFHWWQDEEPDIRQRLDTAVEAFARAFDFDPTELRQWAFAQAVLGAWWIFDEMPDIYSGEVANADIWEV